MCVGVCELNKAAIVVAGVCLEPTRLQPKIWRTMSLCLSTHLSQRGQVRGPDGREITKENSLKLWRGGGGGD